MSAAEHTPGPLHVAACPRHELGFSCTAVRIADGTKLQPTVGDLFLHAAGPDLLAFAREVENWIEHHGEAGDEGALALLTRARDLILKAGGHP